MKNLFLLTLLFVSFQVFSQNPSKTKSSPENRADHAVKRWTNVLNLTTDQQPKVRAVILERIQKIEGIKSKYQNSKNKKEMHSEIKAVRENSDKSIEQILTPDQNAQLKKMKEEKRQKAQAKKGKPAEQDTDDLVDE